MQCKECSHEFEGRRCSNCGALPVEHEKQVRFEDILFSKKFQRRLYADLLYDAKPGQVRFKRDEIPWDQW
jgi:hypothetical protein